MYIYLFIIYLSLEYLNCGKREGARAGTPQQMYYSISWLKSFYIQGQDTVFWRGKTTFFTMATQLQNGKRECSKEMGLTAFHALQRQNTKISKQVLYFQKRNIGVSVSIFTFMRLWANYMYIPTIGLPILLEEICRPILGLYTVYRHMNIEIGVETALFPEKEYINGIFHAVWPTHFKICDLYFM